MKIFHKAILTAIIIFSGVIPTDSANARNKKPEIVSAIVKSEPKAIPEIEYLDKDGETRNLSELQGKVVIVNFWALWCFPCKEEMPSLNRLAKAYKSKGLVVLPLVNGTDGHKQIEAFYKKNKITELGINFDDSNRGFKAFGLRGLPTSIILNKNGEEVGRVAGYNDWNSKKTRSFIDKLLAE